MNLFFILKIFTLIKLIFLKISSLFTLNSPIREIIRIFLKKNFKKCVVPMQNSFFFKMVGFFWHGVEPLKVPNNLDIKERQVMQFQK